jgi:hypothetical protein
VLRLVCQLWHCAAIPGDVHAGNALCGRDNTTPTPVVPTPELSPVMRLLNEHEHTLDDSTNDDRAQTPVKATPRSYSPTSTGATMTPAEARAHHQLTPGARIRKDDGLAWRIAHQYTTTVRFTVQHTCNCLYLVYKRRRQTPSRGHAITTRSIHNSHSTTHDIGTRINHPSWDLEDLPPHPSCL